MQLVYVIEYEIVAILFCTVMLIFCYTQYSKDGGKIKPFKELILLVLMANVFDVAVSVALSNPEKVPIIVNQLLMISLYVCQARVGERWCRYVHCYVVGKSEKSVLLKVNQIVLGFFVLLLIVNIYAPFIYYYDEQEIYQHANGFFLIYAFVVYYMLACAATVIRNRKSLNVRQAVGSVSYLVLMILSMMLEIFVLKNTPLVLYVLSVDLLILFFTLETPDYQKMRRTRVELVKAKREAEKAKEKAEEASQAKLQFLANVSHEIRTPINATLGMNQMILGETKEEAVKEYARDAYHASETLLKIVNDILDISKIDTGKMPILKVNYNLAVILSELMDEMYESAKRKDLFLKFNVEDHLPAVLRGDDVRLKQIIRNILSNAIKYTHKGGVYLHLDGERKDNKLVLHCEIEDTGIGIKEDDLERIALEFERLDLEKNQNIEGTGLGLSITTRLLDMMGSKLIVRSTYGKGSLFSFDIEQEVVDELIIGEHEWDKEYLNRKYLKEQAIQVEAFSGLNAAILIVDDNTVNRTVLKGLLKTGKFEIDEAKSGEECLWKVQNKHYDLIFLDHLMPEMNGVETLISMQTIEHRCEGVPVIAMTAMASEEEMSIYLDYGFDDCLVKPISMPKLVEILHKYLKVSEDENQNSQNVEKGEGPEKDVLLQTEGTNWEYAKYHFESEEELRVKVREFVDNLSENTSQLSSPEEDLAEFAVHARTLRVESELLGLLELSALLRIQETAANHGELANVQAMQPFLIHELNETQRRFEPYM